MVKIVILDHFMGPGMQPPISPLLSTCEPTLAFWPVFGLYLAYIWPIGVIVGLWARIWPDVVKMTEIVILDHFMGPGMQPPISPLLSTCEPTPAFWPVFGLYLAYIWPIGAQVGIYPAPRGRTGDLGVSWCSILIQKWSVKFT